MKNDKPFSQELEEWLKSKKPKTLGGLQDVFGERSFALAFILLLFLPALPIPTGGITHIVLLPIAMLLALEMIVARRTIWLPKRWEKHSLGVTTQKKALPFILKRIRWVERYSRPRFAGLLDRTIMRSLIGFVIFGFSLAAFLAPPFSGLDTLPSMGGVVVALSIVFEDVVVLIGGLIIGCLGIGLTIGVGDVLLTLIRQIF